MALRECGLALELLSPLGGSSDSYKLKDGVWLDPAPNAASPTVRMASVGVDGRGAVLWEAIVVPKKRGARLCEHDLLADLEAAGADDQEAVEEVFQDFTTSETEREATKATDGENALDVEADRLQPKQRSDKEEENRQQLVRRLDAALRCGVPCTTARALQSSRG